jgi:hypothetical protein
MTSGFGAREQSRAEKTCGRANTLVDLCNSRAGSLWPLLGARRKMAGLVWKSHRMENGHERKPGAYRFFPWRSPIIYAIISPTAAGQGRWRVYFELCAFYCCNLLLLGGRPPSFTDPPAAVEVGWCSCRSMNRTLHKVNSNASLVTCQSHR